MMDQDRGKKLSKDVIRVFDDPTRIDGAAWNALLAQQSRRTPFMRWQYLAALHASSSAVASTGWAPRFVTVQRAGVLVAAAPAYLKTHSYGEYVLLCSAWPKSNKCYTNQRVRGIMRGRRISIQGIEMIVRLL